MPRNCNRLGVVAWLVATAVSVPARAAPTSPLEEFRARHGAAWQLQFDGATGRPRRLWGGALEWLPDGPSPTQPADLDARLVELSRTFLRESAQLMAIDPSALRPSALGPISASGGHLRVVSFDVAPHGVPVAGARVTLAVSHGRLVGVHAVGTEPVSADPEPRVAAEAAIATALAARGWSPSDLLRSPRTELWFVREGGGHRLAWRVTLVRGDPPARAVVHVDALDGALISSSDETVQSCDAVPSGERRVMGGVRGNRADAPERRELLRASTVGGVVVGGDGLFAPPRLPYAGALTGPAVSVECQGCSSPAVASAPAAIDGDVDFGSGGADEIGNGLATPADRSAFFHVEEIGRIASRFLDLAWLREPVLVRTNIPGSCNAYWDGAAVSFLRSSPSCSNSAEVRDVVHHEWGHGLDENDGLAPSFVTVDAATGEAVADIVALLRGRDACIGESYYLDPAEHASPACSGVRDLDEETPGHPIGRLALADVASKCESSRFYRGPAGGQGHCEGQVLGQAFWHLVRELRASLSEVAAWQVAESLFYGSRPLLASYAPSTLQGIGPSAYEAFLIADDEGDGLANGTPHAAQINAAFMHHGLAETPLVPDAPEPAPVRDPGVMTSVETDAASGLGVVRVGWSDVGAAAYRVLRADDPDVADVPVSGRLPAGTTSFVDRGVLTGRTYAYRVVAEDATGQLSTGVPAAATIAGPILSVAAVAVMDVPPGGDGDGMLELGESAELFVTIVNTGDAPATNATAMLTAADPELGVLVPGPATLGSLAPGGSSAGAPAFRVQVGWDAPSRVRLIVAVEAQEGCLGATTILPVGGPDLALAGQVVDEVPGGDGDGNWEPGEQATLEVLLRNDGDAGASSVEGTLSFRGIGPPGVTITTPTATWPSIDPGGGARAGLAPFELAATAAVAARTPVALRLELRVGGFTHRRFDLDVSVGGFPPGNLEWTFEQVGPPHATGQPLVLHLHDTDGDSTVTACDMPAVIVGHARASMTVVAGDTGAVVNQFVSPCPFFAGWSAPAGGDLDGDGANEIVVASDLGVTCAMTASGELLWSASTNGTNLRTPRIMDIDADGRADVLVGDSWLDGPTGVVRRRGRTGAIDRVLAGDVDLDGRIEVITREDGGFTPDGLDHVAVFPSLTWYSALGNLDDDPHAEIVYVTGSGLGLTLVARHHDGAALFEIPVGLRTSDLPSPPCTGDLDGDGKSEIVVPGSDVLMAIDDDGSLTWSVDTFENRAASGCAIFDFEGDGFPEIAYRDAQVLWLFDGRTGDVRWQTNVPSWTMMESPVIADVDLDGSAELVVVWSEPDGPTARSGLMAFGNPAWQPARSVWTSAGYSVTEVSEGGGVVANPLPPWLSPNVHPGQVGACPCVAASIAVTPSCDGLEACFAILGIDAGRLAQVRWSFGDGSPDVAALSPCHVFPGAGAFLVEAVVTDTLGCAARVATLHVVREASVAVVVEPSIACVGETTTFTATAEGAVLPVACSWSFGDSSPVETGGLVARHAYSTAGSFVVGVSVRDASRCEVEASHAVTVIGDATGALEVSGASASAPLRVAKAGPGALDLEFEVVPHAVAVYSGDLQSLHQAGYDHESEGTCNARDGAARVAMPTGSRYFLVVARPCQSSPGLEGAYGFDSFGRRIPSAGELTRPTCP